MENIKVVHDFVGALEILHAVLEEVGRNFLAIFRNVEDAPDKLRGVESLNCMLENVYSGTGELLHQEERVLDDDLQRKLGVFNFLKFSQAFMKVLHVKIVVRHHLVVLLQLGKFDTPVKLPVREKDLVNEILL